MARVYSLFVSSCWSCNAQYVNVCPCNFWRDRNYRCAGCKENWNFIGLHTNIPLTNKSYFNLRCYFLFSLFVLRHILLTMQNDYQQLLASGSLMLLLYDNLLSSHTDCNTWCDMTMLYRLVGAVVNLLPAHSHFVALGIRSGMTQYVKAM